MRARKPTAASAIASEFFVTIGLISIGRIICRGGVFIAFDDENRKLGDFGLVIDARKALRDAYENRLTKAAPDGRV